MYLGAPAQDSIFFCSLEHLNVCATYLDPIDDLVVTILANVCGVFVHWNWREALNICATGGEAVIGSITMFGSRTSGSHWCVNWSALVMVQSPVVELKH